MTETIVIARDMIRILGDEVEACSSKVPSIVYDAIHRVEDALDDHEIDYSTLLDEKMKIEKLAAKFEEKCTCEVKSK